MAGSLIGFYPWNKPPAKIFMGDTGSLFIGLLLAACSLAKPSKSPTALIIGGPILALALPVIDLPGPYLLLAAMPCGINGLLVANASNKRQEFKFALLLIVLSRKRALREQLLEQVVALDLLALR